VRAAEYAALVAGLLPPADPQAQALTQAAAALDQALAAGAPTLDQAIAAYHQAVDAVKDRVIDAVLDAVPVRDLLTQAKQAGLADAYQLHAEAHLGPLFLAVSSPSARLADPRGGAPVAVGPMPPNAVRARLDAGPVRGDGTLVIEPDRVGGLLAARLGTIEVAALASLARTPQGGPSFLAAFSAGFTPGIQLGFGFQIARVGGLVGIERTLDQAAMAAGLRDGTLGAVLFPLDAGPSARAALAAAERMFPPAPGSAVVGPTFRLSWLEVEGHGFASVDLGVLIRLPGPVIALVGVFKAGIPGATALLRLRADLLGVLDFPARRATIDASLVDSGALGIFTVYGDLAFAQGWGPTPYTVLSLGGFFPGFRPEPAQIRPLNRLGMSLDSPVPGLRIRAEGYLAATSNTLQLGGRLEVGIDAVVADISGDLGVDALIQFTPFHVRAEVTAGLRVRFLGKTFAGVRFTGSLDGPGPVTIHGRVTVETFIKDLDWEDTFVLGRPEARPPVLPDRAARVLAAEEFAPTNVRALGGIDPSVALAGPGRAGTRAVVAPLTGLVWTQHRIPLDLPLDRLDGAPLGTVQTVHASAPNQTGTERDRFAPGSFLTLTKAQALATPTYDLLPSGVQVGAGARMDGAHADGDGKPQVLRKVRGEPSLAFRMLALASAPFPGGLLAMLDERDGRAAVADAVPRVTAPAPTWVSTADGATHASTTQAVRASLLRGGAALHEADAARPVALAGL
jgi:hypothetical protein